MDNWGDRIFRLFWKTIWWFLSGKLALYLIRGSFEERLFSWANRAIDQRASAMTRLIAEAVKWSIEHPILLFFYLLGSYCIVVVFVAVVPLAWRRAERIRRGVSVHPAIELCTGSTRNGGLVVWLQNNSGNTVAACSLALTMLECMRPSQKVFTKPGLFSTLHLIRPQDIQGKNPTEVAPFVTVVGDDKNQARIEDCFGKKKPEVLLQAGTWRAKFYIGQNDGQGRNEFRCFRWKPGTDPEFVPDPTSHI
jgi:hypothetical protein